MNTVSIYYSYDKRGPGKVIENLTKGLIENECKVILNPENPSGYISLLQDHPIWKSISKSDALCGPNLFVLPSNNKELCKKFNHFVCPSKWIYDKYKKYDDLSHATLDIWSCGIDTEIWNSKRKQEIGKKNIILYVKNRSSSEITEILSGLSRFPINVAVIQYGEYTEDHLRNLCSQADACVLLTGTESQGIAYMQILSCGIPCYVIDVKNWMCQNSGVIFPATSVPYFDDSCGVISSNLEEESFSNFLKNLKNFQPRSFILNEHSLRISSNKYLKILEKNSCKVW